MFNKSNFTAYFTLCVVLFFFMFPASSFAKWEDKSDELPGMMSTEDIILIGVGTAAVIGLIYLISHSSDKNKSNEKEMKSVTSDSTASSSAFDKDSFSQSSLVAEQDVSIMPYVSWQKPEATFALADSKDLGRVVVGVTVTF